MKLIKEKDIRQEYSVLFQEAAMKGGGAGLILPSAAEIIMSPNRKLCSSSRQRFHLSHATPARGRELRRP